MTSVFSSIFGSSSAVTASRIETMKSAEKALASFAHRFQFHDDDHDLHQQEHENHDIHLFDTTIPRSTVPLKSGSKYKCQMFSCANGSGNATTKSEEALVPGEQLIIHGVQVTHKKHRKSGAHADSSMSGAANSTDSEAPLVLLHGYMNGGLYFYRNLVGLANHCKTVYSLDMLGWGLSSRPSFEIEKKANHANHPFNLKDSNKKDKHQTYATEQVFVESLEAWRKAHNIPKMTLAAHSMGGYMSVAYCEKYPERVERLILISPAGVPDDEHVDVKKRFQGASLGIRAMFKVVHSLFEVGVTPAAFLRNLPESRGRGMVARYIQGRLPAITNEEEQKFLGEYLYTNAALPASGEDCLKNVLKPTAFARVPTLHRIPRLKVKHVSFIYGQTDWMDPTGGIEVMEKVEQLDKNSDHSPPTVEVYGVKNAGHLLMLENWKEFNSAMVIAMGRRHALPTKAPLPYKVLDTGSSSNGLFFMKPRWEKKEDESQEDDQNQNQHANQGTPSMQG